jgi:catechol 2,3-dioxygenase-like lactoylglutathione lyase family enzyme
VQGGYNYSISLIALPARVETVVTWPDDHLLALVDLGSKVSDSFTTCPSPPPSVWLMNVSVQSVVVEIVARDVARTVEFYRLLGLEIPDPYGPHVEVALPGGNRLAFDTEDVIASMHPGWTPPTGPGRVAIAFGLDVPAAVDAMYERITAAGHPGTLKPYDAPWGQRYATVRDPDGTSVDLFAPLG